MGLFGRRDKAQFTLSVFGLTLLALLTSSVVAMPRDCETDLLSAEDRLKSFRHALRLLEQKPTGLNFERIRSLALLEEDWVDLFGAFSQRMSPEHRAFFKDYLEEVVPHPEGALLSALRLNLLNEFSVWNRLSKRVHFDQISSEDKIDLAANVRGAGWYVEGLLDPLELTTSEKAKTLALCVARFDQDHPLIEAFFEKPERFLNREGIVSAEDRILVLKSWLERYPERFYNRLIFEHPPLIHVFDDTPGEELVQLLFKVARFNYDHTGRIRLNRKSFAERFPSLTRDDQVRFFANAFVDWENKFGYVDSVKNPSEYLPDSNPSRSGFILFLKVALKGLNLNRLQKPKFLKSLVGEFLSAGGIPRISDIAEIDALLYERFPLMQILNYSVDGIDTSVLSDWYIESNNDGNIGLRKLFEDYSQVYPERMAKGSAARIFWEPTRDSALARELIEKYYDPEVKIFAEESPPKETLELVGRLVGLDVEPVRESRVAKNPLRVYQQLLQILDRVERPFFEGVRFAPEVFRRRGIFVNFLTALSDSHLAALYEGEAADKNSTTRFATLQKVLIRSGFYQSDVIDGDFLRTLTQELIKRKHEGALEKTQKLIHTLTGRDVSFPRSWGDPGPFLMLLRRFKESGSYPSDLVKIVTSGEAFQQYKFGTPENPSKEIEFLSPEMHQKWTRDRIRLSLVDSEANLAEQLSSRLTQVREFIREHFLFEGLPFQSEELVEFGKKYDLEPLLKEIRTGKPLDLLKDWADEAEWTWGNESAERLLGLVELELKHSEGKQVQEYELWARVGIASVDYLIANQSRNVNQLVERKESFRQIARLARIDLEQMTKNGVVFSSLSSDPMFMLTVGDLVNCTSCINYRKGQSFKFLPSYIGDGNIRVLASFHLGPKDFDLKSDYLRFYAAAATQEGYDASWDGNKRVLTLKIQTGKNSYQEIKTRPLVSGYRRNIVRLGEAYAGKKVPSLRLEKTYLEDHPAGSIMRANHLEIFRELSEEMEARNDRVARFTSSRSDHGTYTDSLRRGLTDAYDIPMQDLEGF